MSACLVGSVFPQSSVFLEDLTWTEVRDAVSAGTTTVIIPTGGTEQNGPHMILGKHNVRVRYTSGEIARRLGGALVAPVMPYTPEGDIAPATGHMRFPGTITLPAEYFAKVVEFAARSLEAHGFTDIVLIGDSTPNQAPLKAVADMLNREWASTSSRVHHLDKYQNATGFSAWLVAPTHI
jgi:creatinine amidohydrolase/Fe(II)-dependent formamide hydrolase-like protein